MKRPIEELFIEDYFGRSGFKETTEIRTDFGQLVNLLTMFNDKVKIEFDAINVEKKDYRDKMDSANAEIVKLKHGGTRPGAGAKKKKKSEKKEPTKVIRVPISRVAAVLKAIGKA